MFEIVWHCHFVLLPPSIDFRLSMGCRRKVKALLSDEHFPVGGTLIQTWATLARGCV
jgi:hypothetical protein